MNKHRGTDFYQYLEQKGVLEEVKALAKEQLEMYIAEAEAEEKAENAKKTSERNGLFAGLRHRIRHLFSA